MAVTLDTYGPFDAGAGANWTEDTWRSAMRHMLGSSSGVIRGFLDEFAIYADSSGMQVKARTGECWIRGHYGLSTSEKILPIEAAHATLPRKDRAILRADFAANLLEVAMLTGTPASTPTPMSLAQNLSRWETSLAVVDVPAADTAIDLGQVTDDRTYTSVQVRRYASTAQSIPNSTATKIIFDTVAARSDAGTANDLYWDPADRAFVVVRPGLYSVMANLRYASNGTGRRWLFIAPNNDAFTDRLGQQLVAAISGAEVSLNCSTQSRFVTGDRIHVWGEQNSGGALNTDFAFRSVNASVVWLGP